jgi:predicted secreted protein
MAVISGTQGSVVYGGTAGTIIAGLKTWSLDIAATELDASNFGSTWKLTESGIKEWSGQVEGNYDDTDAQQTALWTALTAGSKAVVNFYQGTADYFSGTIVVVGHSPSQSFDGLGAGSWSFKGHGPLTRT